VGPGLPSTSLELSPSAFLRAGDLSGAAPANTTALTGLSYLCPLLEDLSRQPLPPGPRYEFSGHYFFEKEHVFVVPLAAEGLPSPTFDTTLLRLLERDSQAVVALVPLSTPSVAHQQLLRRLRRRLQGAAERARLLPALHARDRRELLAIAIAALDPDPTPALVFALEAAAVGCPVVARGRLSGLMRRVGAPPELWRVGDERGFVEVAARLALEPAWRAEVAAAVRAGVGRAVDEDCGAAGGALVDVLGRLVEGVEGRQCAV
jgi:hypothetical protein